VSEELLWVWVKNSVCFMGTMPAYDWNEVNKTGSMSVTTHWLQKFGYLFSEQHCHRWWEFGASLGPSSEKPVTIIILLLPEIKNLRLNLLLENACSPFFEAREASFTSSMWAKVRNQLQDLCEDPKEVETVSLVGGEKSCCFFNVITQDLTIMLPLQWW